MIERVLVTGGGGFIGACLTRELLQEGQEVHLLLRPETNRWRLTDLEGRFVAHPADLLDAAAVRRVLAAARPDVVYHLASHGVDPGQRQRAAVLAGNILGTAHLLEAAYVVGCRAIVHAGTGWEYGSREGAVEETALVHPHTDYGVAKAAASLLCLADSCRGRPVVVVRIFSAYGPWEGPRRLVPYLMGCCVRGEAPRVSSGWQRRDFVHVEDVVALLRRATDLVPSPGLVLHAGCGREYSVREMVQTVWAVCGGRQPPVYGAEAVRPDEPASCLASVARTTALTGWTARHELRAGVERTWVWHQDWAGRRAA